MKIKVECIEPESLPIRREINVVQLEPFRIFILNDVKFAGPAALRNTMLLKASEDPPPEASLVMEMDIYNPGAGDPLVFRVRKLGRWVHTDLVRPNVRSRLAEGHEVPSGSRLEMILQDTRRVLVTLQLETDQMRNSQAVGAGAYRHKPAQSMSAGWFLYNSVMQLLAINGTVIKDKIILYLRKWGIHPTIFLTIASLGLVLGMAGFVAYNRHQAAADAEERAAQLKEAQEKSEETKDLAISNEKACLDERRKLAAKLGLKQAEQMALVQSALDFPFTQSVAVGVGGREMSINDNEEKQKLESDFIQSTSVEVIERMKYITADLKNLDFCLEQKHVLGTDLPRYILSWHRDSQMLCPPAYDAVESGVSYRGSWGLSNRVAADFGAQSINTAGSDGAATSDSTQADGDPRSIRRWSATHLAEGLRMVQTAMLTTDTGSRMQVSASQAHLWTLAVWDAYNQMPSSEQGVMDKKVDYCVEDFMKQMTNGQDVATPGTPILPNLVDVANGDVDIIVTPSPGCPWPSKGFEKGAQNALQAAANLALYIEEVEKPRLKKEEEEKRKN